jgi:2,4-dienoyl-CoA reductase-like NADH-dependent reductase (Old Yellow Enzyme family)
MVEVAFESGAVDLATFGAPFLAKPNLVERLLAPGSAFVGLKRARRLRF